jgi:hypothetical protein
LDESEEDSMNQLQGHSITYRIAVGPHQGRKVFTLQTLPGTEEPFLDTVDAVAGFSLHASVAVKVSERNKLERICEGGPTATSAGRQCLKKDCH